MAAHSQVVIEDAQRDRPELLAAGSEHLERSMVEVELPQRPDVRGFITADFARLSPLSRSGFARAFL
jgi:hypothetical protein